MNNKILLACVLVAGGAIGLALPGADAQLEQPGEPAPERAPQAEFASETRLAALQEDNAAAWNEEVVLQRENDGHFYANVQIGGSTYRMLVDTGATVVALSAMDANAMGLYWDPAEIAPVAQGASGPVDGVNTSIDRMALGGHEASDVRAIIITEGAMTSLLGQSFLSTIGKVEISGDRMILGN